MSSESIIFLSNVAPALPFHYYPLRNHPIDAFSYCPWKWIYEGHTVTYVALQIAFFFGFETVLVVGLDHRYTFEGQPNELREMQGDDPNHFDPGYFEGQFWHNPDLAKADEAFRIAREAFEYDNRHIYNLTPDTGTDAFEKGGIAAWI